MTIRNYQLRPDDRILYLRLSSIGDVVNAIPGLVALRRSFPNTFITWCVEEMSADILKGHPCLDELLIIPDSWRRSPLTPKTLREVSKFVRKLRALKFTMAIDAHNLLKSGLVAYLSGAHMRAGARLRRNIEGHKLFLNILLDSGQQAQGPAAAARAQFLRGLGVDLSDLRYELPPFIEERREIAALLTAAGIGDGDLTIVLNPCASRANKQWPGEYFVELGKYLVGEHGATIIWTGAADERRYIEKLAASMPGRTINLAGLLNLRQLAALFQQTNLLITGDTGPMHIGAAAGIFVVSLMGSTNPAHHGPFTARRLVLTAGVACQYCGKRRCPTQIECLAQLTPAKVIEEVGALIQARVWEKEAKNFSNQVETGGTEYAEIDRLCHNL